MTYRFIPRTYFVYNEKKHAWLSLKGDWTTVFWDAHNFDSEAQATDRSWPDSDYDDCYVLAWDGRFDRTGP